MLALLTKGDYRIGPFLQYFSENHFNYFLMDCYHNWEETYPVQPYMPHLMFHYLLLNNVYRTEGGFFNLRVVPWFEIRFCKYSPNFAVVKQNRAYDFQVTHLQSFMAITCVQYENSWWRHSNVLKILLMAVENSRWISIAEKKNN